MRTLVGRGLVGVGVLVAVATVVAFLWGLAYPPETWTGDARTAFTWSQSVSGMTCGAAGVLLAVFGGIVVRGDDSEAP